MSKDVLNRAIGMIELRDNVRELLNMQLNNSDGTLDGDIAASREKLNKTYDSFVAKYGNVSDRKNANQSCPQMCQCYKVRVPELDF